MCFRRTNNKFKDLEIAISSLEEKLKNLYGVEGELASLSIAINTHKDFISNLENEKSKKTEEIEKLTKTLEEEYRIRQEELKKEYELEVNKIKIERKREEEEYDYNKKREREISDNKWIDQKIERENALSKKEEEITKLLDDAKANEEYLKKLENEVN